MTGGKFWEIKCRNSSHRASPHAFVALLMLILSQPGGLDARDFVAFSSFCCTIPVAGLLLRFLASGWLTGIMDEWRRP
jgi:hypothetical protein